MPLTGTSERTSDPRVFLEVVRLLEGESVIAERSMSVREAPGYRAAQEDVAQRLAQQRAIWAGDSSDDQQEAAVGIIRHLAERRAQLRLPPDENPPFLAGYGAYVDDLSSAIIKRAPRAAATVPTTVSHPVPTTWRLSWWLVLNPISIVVISLAVMAVTRSWDITLSVHWGLWGVLGGVVLCALRGHRIE